MLNKTTLLASLLATYEAHPELVPWEDEDFKEDPDGDWIKLESGYTIATIQKSIIGTIHVGLRSTEEDRAKFRSYCKEIDQMTHYTEVTTLDQRRLRYARKRTEEIVSMENYSTSI